MGLHGQKYHCFRPLRCRSQVQQTYRPFFLTQVDANTIKPKKLGDTVTDAFLKCRKNPPQSTFGNYAVLYRTGSKLSPFQIVITGERKIDIEKNSGIVVEIQGKFYPANKKICHTHFNNNRQTFPGEVQRRNHVIACISISKLDKYCNLLILTTSLKPLRTS